MIRMKNLAAITALLAPLAWSPLAFADDALAEAEAMLAKAEEMRAEADAMAEKAAEMMAAAKAAATEEAETAPEAKDEDVEEAAEEQSEGEMDNIASAYEEGGKFFTEDDVPTFNVADDGTVDWNTFSGFRRYHSECHVCHGPDGEGSSYAPALKKSAVEMDYYDFVDVVVNGRKKVGASSNSVMPSFGDNKNVMCYLDDMYIYLKARGTEDVARGRPAKKAKKSAEYKEQENACMDG